MRPIVLSGLMAFFFTLPAGTAEAVTSDPVPGGRALRAEPVVELPGTRIHRPYTFTYVRTGGLLGVREELVVDSAAMRITYRSRDDVPEGKSAQATEADLRELEEMLERANFMRVSTHYTCGTCADHYNYSATLVMGGAMRYTRTVRWEGFGGESFGRVPPEIAAIEALASKLIQEVFERTLPPAAH